MALLNLQPRPKFKSSAATAIHLASIYEEAESNAGYKDFLNCILTYQSQLQNDLNYGRLSSNENIATTSDLQAMLFVLRRVLSIPVESKEHYVRWRSIQDELGRSGIESAPDAEVDEIRWR